tara:strand:+ start:567 stop:773 length:207 start_codon:yes stop_codon:yes gene_type:complete
VPNYQITIFCNECEGQGGFELQANNPSSKIVQCDCCKDGKVTFTDQFENILDAAENIPEAIKIKELEK